MPNDLEHIAPIIERLRSSLEQKQSLIENYFSNQVNANLEEDASTQSE